MVFKQHRKYVVCLQLYLEIANCHLTDFVFNYRLLHRHSGGIGPFGVSEIVRYFCRRTDVIESVMDFQQPLARPHCHPSPHCFTSTGSAIEGPFMVHSTYYSVAHSGTRVVAALHK